MSEWRQVVEAHEAPKGRIRLALECGHETTINPTLPLLAIRRGLLSSRVPCPICGRVEAPLSAKERARDRWSMANGEEIVRPSKRYL